MMSSAAKVWLRCSLCKDWFLRARRAAVDALEKRWIVLLRSWLSALS